ncbi:DUF2459 domain-containing protein [Bacteroidota bacterium]
MYSEIETNRTLEIYLVKQYWHTAIVIKREDINEEFLNDLNVTGDANLVDFGWGDEEFYQFPGFDSGLAFKALFYKTSSTLRVETIRISKESYFDLSEIVIKINVTKAQLEQILKFINNTLYRNRQGKIELISERGLGRVKFFRAIGDYHLFNTCNTWIANCLVNSGIEIENNVILTEQLFNEAVKIGDVMKVIE